MYLATNCISFNGKNDVLYGLKNAAKAAKQLELNKALAEGPRPVDTYYEQIENAALLKAYADMAAHDETFSDVVKEFTEKNDLKAILAPLQMQQTLMNPIKVEPVKAFKTALLKAMRKHHNKPEPKILNQFFKNITM